MTDFSAWLRLSWCMAGRITPILITLICVLLLISSCSLLRKRTPAQRLAQLQKEVSNKGGVVFSTELKGSSVSFLLLDCNLCMLDASTDKIGRTKVLSPDLYLWFTVCLEQSIRKDGEYVHASLRRRLLAPAEEMQEAATIAARMASIGRSTPVKDGELSPTCRTDIPGSTIESGKCIEGAFCLWLAAGCYTPPLIGRVWLA